MFLIFAGSNGSNLHKGTQIVRYDFKVMKGDETIAVAQSAALPDLESVWPMVVELAQSIDDVGSRIVVKNEAGEVVVFVGVATASSLLNTTKRQKSALKLHDGLAPSFRSQV